MKALSVKQPFAGLIARGIKTLEIRSQKTNYRGELLICSASKPVHELTNYYHYLGDISSILYSPESMNDRFYQNGLSICKVNLIDCIPFDGTSEQNLAACLEKEAINNYFPKPNYYAWVLEGAKPIEPFRVKGQLGIFNIEFNR